MLKNLYKEKALVTVSPWIKTEKLEKPVLNIEKSGIFTNVSWISIQQERVFHWILFLNYGDKWEYVILEKKQTSKSLPLNKNGKKLNNIAVKSVDRLGNESDYSAASLIQNGY